MISKFWTEKNKQLDNLILDDDLAYINSDVLKEIVITPYNKNFVVCDLETDILLNKFKNIDNISVLEIGAGYGNFCAVLHNKLNIKSYTILDTPSMLRICKHFLNVCNIEVNYVSNLTDLKYKSFDLFVSKICLSEIPEDYMLTILNTILPNCYSFFIIDIDKTDKSFYNNLIYTIKKYFDIIIEEKCLECMQLNHNLYYGRKVL